MYLIEQVGRYLELGLEPYVEVINYSLGARRSRFDINKLLENGTDQGKMATRNNNLENE